MDDEVEIILQQDSVEVTEPLVGDYILPTASSSTLGGVKIGNNIDIDSAGHISVPVASTTGLGVVQAGTGIAIDGNGVISATGEYELPQATKTTLGGVYVDDALSNSSQNPVQNSVVSLEFSEVNSDITTLNSTVGGHTTSISNLSNTVGTLSTSVTNLSNTVDGHTTSITNINNSLNGINGNIVDINDDITSLGNGLGQLQNNVDPVLDNYTEVIDGTDIDNTVWTTGKLSIYNRGRTGIIYSNLEGSLTISANDSEVIYTITDSDYFPTVEAIGLLYTDVGWLECVVNTSGEIVIYNNTASSITITELKGNIPVVWN